MKQLDGPFLTPKSGKAKQLVVLLHGYGDSGAGLIGIGHEWREALPDAAFVAPNAPDICEQFAGGYQWFSLRAIDRDSIERGRQAETVAPVLSHFIDQQLEKWGLDDSALAVAGFSQGAMMAMYTMPRRKKPCACVIGYSGMLIDAAALKGEGIVKMPILAIHGDSDDVVPPENLQIIGDGFSAAGFNIETIMRQRLGHSIDSFGLMRGADFIVENTATV